MRCDAMRWDAMRHDTIRYDTIRYDTIQCDTIRYDTISFLKHGKNLHFTNGKLTYNRFKGFKYHELVYKIALWVLGRLLISIIFRYCFSELSK